MRERSRVAPALDPLRFDLLVNPYGASLRVAEALASHDDLHLPAPDRLTMLRARLGELHGLPASWISPANGIADLIHGAMRLTDGAVCLFPPSDPEHGRIAGVLGVKPVEVARSHRFAVDIDPASFSLPPKTLSLVQSPNDPTGMILSAQDAVRLSRKSHLLVVDERHVAYSPRTLVPLVREFDNVIVLRTFETWAGLSGLPFAYAVAPPKLAAALGATLIRPDTATAAVIAAEATLDDLPYMLATVDRIREEKSRLYRTLRKLNMLRPYPSWANFLVARIERGDVDFFDEGLRQRDMAVHRPAHESMREFVRISAVSADATARLKSALIEIAAPL